MSTPQQRRQARTERARQWFLPLLVATVLLGLWQAWTVIQQVPTYLVPSPWAIAQTLVEDWALLIGSLWVTVKITVLSFLAATVIGALIAFAFVQSRWIEAAFFPYAVLLQVTPIVAIALLIIIWVKDPTLSLVVCATLVALFPIISNTTVGLRSVNPGLAAYFQLQRATRWQTLVRLRIPSALPYFFAGLRISGGLALIGAVVAEFVAGSGGAQGLAWRILEAYNRLQTARVFAALLALALLGVALHALMELAERRLLAIWRGR